MENFTFTPIGHLVSELTEKYMAPKQAELGFQNEGKIFLNPHCNFEQALEDLEGFSRIWVIYAFHHNHTWTPKVRPPPPRGGKKRGVFATRAPHRPNSIGLSCVELLAVEGRCLRIGKNDLLSGTPILDIKPYLPYADSFPESTQGWLEEGNPRSVYDIEWSLLAQKQAHFIETHTFLKFIDTVELRLTTTPFPFPNQRIKALDVPHFELSLKTWRLKYAVEGQRVLIQEIYSGYDKETLEGLKMSKWDDVPLHREFMNKFLP